MPVGIEVVVENGEATVDFVDPLLKGQGIAALLEVTPPKLVDKVTGPAARVRYRVPEQFARAAGFLDEASTVEAFVEPDTSSFTDASGFVASEGPSTTDLFAQDLRGGTFRNDPVEPVKVGEATVAVTVESDLGALTDLVDQLSTGDASSVVAAPTDEPAAVTETVVTEPPAASAPTVEAAPAAEPVVEQSGPGYDDGFPDMDWSRPAINAFAAALQPPVGPLDTTGAKNRAEAIAAIKKAVGRD
jgi:hypothetical protein